MPTTLSWSRRSRATVSGATSTAVRIGHVVERRSAVRGTRAATVEYQLVQALLGGPRVVRRDHEGGVGAEVDGGLGQLERLVELRRAGAGQERHPVGDLLGRRSRIAGDPLGDGLRARLAGRAADARCRASRGRAATAPGGAGSSWSTSPSAVNGVTTGAIEPRHARRVRRADQAAPSSSLARSARATSASIGYRPSTGRALGDPARAIEAPPRASCTSAASTTSVDEVRRDGRRRRRRRRRSRRRAARRRPPQAIVTSMSHGTWRRPSTAGWRRRGVHRDVRARSTAAASRTPPSVTMPAAPRTWARRRGCRRPCRLGLAAGLDDEHLARADRCRTRASARCRPPPWRGEQVLAQRARTAACGRGRRASRPGCVGRTPSMVTSCSPRLRSCALRVATATPAAASPRSSSAERELGGLGLQLAGAATPRRAARSSTVGHARRSSASGCGPCDDRRHEAAGARRARGGRRVDLDLDHVARARPRATRRACR